MANITNDKISFYITGSEIMAVSSSGELLVSSSAFIPQNLLISQSINNTSSLKIDNSNSYITSILSLYLSQSNVSKPIFLGRRGAHAGIVNSGYVNAGFYSEFYNAGSTILGLQLVNNFNVPDYYSTRIYNLNYASSFGVMVWVWPYGNQLGIGNSNTGKDLTFNNNQLIVNGTVGINTQPLNARLYVGVGQSPKMYTQMTVSGNLNFTVNGNVGISSSATIDKLNISGNLAPYVDDSFDLGTSTNYWRNVYGTAMQISDSDLKKDVQASKLGLHFIKDLEPVKYTFKDGLRVHYGLIAQEVKQTLEKHNIDATDFAGYVESVDRKKFLRYEEFVCPLIKAIQELSTRITALEKEIEARGL